MYIGKSKCVAALDNWELGPTGFSAQNLGIPYCEGVGRELKAPIVWEILWGLPGPCGMGTHAISATPSLVFFCSDLGKPAQIVS